MVTESQREAVKLEILFIQRVSGVYTSRFLVANYPKMALQARKVLRAFKKQAPGSQHSIFSHIATRWS